MRVRCLLFFIVLSCFLAFGQGDQPTSTPSTGTPVGTDPAKSGATTVDPGGGAIPGGDAKSATLPDLTPDAHGALSQQQMQELFRVVAEKDTENNKHLRDYTYIERETESKLDGKGKTKSTEIKTYEILEIYGEQVQRLIEKDSKPLSEKDAKKEEEKIQKIIDKRKNESEGDRKKREEKEEKDREDGRKFVREVADAYNFKLVGTEQIGGREAWVIDGEPRPGYEPHMKEAKFLPKFHGRVWIDKGDLQLAKIRGSDSRCASREDAGVQLLPVVQLEEAPG